jgi:hypothetical protein
MPIYGRMPVCIVDRVPFAYMHSTSEKEHGGGQNGHHIEKHHRTFSPNPARANLRRTIEGSNEWNHRPQSEQDTEPRSI